MTGKPGDVTLIEISEAEAGGDLIRQLEAEAKPDTVQRIAKLIDNGHRLNLTTETIATSICTMLFEGEPIDTA